jgi:hypothetical protein
MLKLLPVSIETILALRPHLETKLLPCSCCYCFSSIHVPSPWCFLFCTQNEIEHRREDPVASPQHPSQQQTHNTPSTNVQCNPFSFGNIATALDYRMDETDQTSNSGVPNSLPDPLRQNFHSNHLIQSSGCGPINSCPNGNGPRNNQSPQNLDSVNCNLTEPSMDMHCDGPWKVRIWKFGSNLSWFVQGIKIWSSLAETKKSQYLLTKNKKPIG